MDEDEPTSKNPSINHLNISQQNSGQVSNSLKNEWSLFWEAIKADGRPDFEEDFDGASAVLKQLTVDQVKEMAKQMSQSRKKLNQKIEAINKEIDLNTVKLETLRLVGAEDDSTLQRINELNDLGQKLSQELFALDEKIKLTRKIESEAKSRQE